MCALPSFVEPLLPPPWGEVGGLERFSRPSPGTPSLLSVHAAAENDGIANRNNTSAPRRMSSNVIDAICYARPHIVKVYSGTVYSSRRIRYISGFALADLWCTGCIFGRAMSGRDVIVDGFDLISCRT